MLVSGTYMSAGTYVYLRMWGCRSEFHREEVMCAYFHTDTLAAPPAQTHTAITVYLAILEAGSIVYTWIMCVKSRTLLHKTITAGRIQETRVQ